MNKLIEIMALDMNIQPYINEPEASFEYRVIYSALGLWCLKSALSGTEKDKGVSKNAQSILLHNLAEKYVSVYPKAKNLIFITRNADIATFIRNVYEQTGYLLTQDNNSNVLNESGETVQFTDREHLYLGLPESGYSVNGLGIYTKSRGIEIAVKDYLIRDSFTPEEYLAANFDECDFDTCDIDLEELEFFDPYYYGNASKSWYKHMKSDITMARKSPIGPYYKVIRKQDGCYLFSEDKSLDKPDALTGAEFRRIYVALKQHYGNPMQILICPIDESYTHIRILGQLPNREYYYLLMSAWPKSDFLDRNNFIIRSELTTKVVEILEAIGFITRNGEFYG